MAGLFGLQSPGKLRGKDVFRNDSTRRNGFKPAALRFLRGRRAETVRRIAPGFGVLDVSESVVRPAIGQSIPSRKQKKARRTRP